MPIYSFPISTVDCFIYDYVVKMNKNGFQKWKWMGQKFTSE